MTNLETGFLLKFLCQNIISDKKTLDRQTLTLFVQILEFSLIRILFLCIVKKWVRLLGLS